MYNDKSENIRVPSNTHPGHLYGDTSPNLMEEEDEDVFHSAYGTPISRQQSIKSTLQNFAGSYSRASVLYTGELISGSQPIVTNDEEQLLFKTHTS